MTKIPWLCEVSSTWWGGGTRFSRFVNLKTCGFFSATDMDFGKKTGLSGAEIWWNHWISKHSGLVLWTHPLVYCRCPWSWTSYHRRGFSTLFYARCWCRGALFVGRGCTTTKCSSTWELPLGCFTAGMWSKFSVPSRKSSHILTLSYPSGIGGSHAWQVWVSRKRIGKDHQ